VVLPKKSLDYTLAAVRLMHGAPAAQRLTEVNQTFMVLPSADRQMPAGHADMV
jgi:hypothetical protein